MKNINISDKGSSDDIEARIIDVTRRNLKDLKSNNYEIVVKRLNDCYSIDIMILDDSRIFVEAP